MLVNNFQQMPYSLLFSLHGFDLTLKLHLRIGLFMALRYEHISPFAPHKSNLNSYLLCSLTDEEILEKSHFKPLRTEEEKVKTVTNSTNVDIKRPKITSVAVNVLREIHPEDSNAATKKFTTVLLNSNGVKKAESTQASLISRAHDSNYSSHHQDLNRSKHKPGEEHIIPLRLVDDHHCRRTYTEPKEDRHVHRTRDSSINKSNSSGAKTDYKPITIIHHGVRLQDKELGNSRRLVHHTSSSSPKKELVGCKPRSRKSVPLPKDPKEPYGSGSLRKKTSVATASGGGRERLFDSGRDSWLNLPKERKPAASSSSTERKEPTKSSKTAQRLRTGELIILWNSKLWSFWHVILEMSVKK